MREDIGMARPKALCRLPTSSLQGLEKIQGEFMESSWRVHNGMVAYNCQHKPADSEAFPAIVFTSLLLFPGGPGWSSLDP